MSFNRQINTENVVHIHHGDYSDGKKNEIMKSAGKWTDLEKITLNEVVQTQKGKYHYS